MKKIIILAAVAVLAAACVTQKSRSDISPVKKFYHDLNSEFNGYFNANEMYEAAILTLEEQHSDNYNRLLPIYAYAAADNPQAVAPDMDEAIKKATVIRALHEPSHWIDDCYLIAGKAQFLKQDFEAAEETFRYLVDQFSPEAKLKKNRKKKSANRSKKKPMTKAQKKAQQKEREQAKKDKEAERKEKTKTRKQQLKEKKKANKKRKREREKELKARRKARKKGIKTPRRPTEVVGNDEAETPKVSKEAADKIEDAAKKAAEEAEQKKKDAKLAKEIEKDEKDRPFKHRSAHQEGQLWLARTYIERDKFDAASYLIKNLEENPNLYRDVAEQLASVKAHLFIKRKQYDNAIAPLELAKELAKDRAKKARYAYILAQLHQQKRATSTALTYFEEVVKLKPSYEMDFSARLSMTLSDYHTGGMGVEAAIKSLEKMLKDEKNIDYKDRIYFAMSEIYLKAGQEEEGIAFLKKALKEGGGNNAQKAEALVKLAYLFYEEEDYVKAADYFGQALSLLPKTDERYDDMERLNNTIADVAKNIQMISLQDSLLRISRMSNDEKRAVAYEIRQQQEKERLERIKNTNNSGGKFGPTPRPSARPGSVNGLAADGSNSNFFAYDERAVKRGKRAFSRAWGGRPLEDDWRRSNRQTSSSLAETNKDDEAASNRLTDEEAATILRGVPQSQKQIEGAENTLADAMFELGVLYRERLQNYKRSVETFEALLERFPEYPNRAEAYYYLYLSHKDLGSDGKARQYRDKLMKDFPDSIFTQVLTDPNYLARINAEEIRLTNYYNAVYANFSSDRYEAAHDSLKLVNAKFGATNPLQPRFALLMAMTLGKLEGKESYVRSLKDVVAKYPNTDEQRRAREILRLLGTNVGTIPGGGNETGEESRFKYEPDKLHYLIIALNASATLNDIKINVSDYNRKYHSQDRLRISNIYLDNAEGGERTPLVVVRRFKTADDVMRYYDGVQKNKKDFIEGTPYELYPITQTNYREILRNKSLDGYQSFFETSYLNR